MYRAYVTKLNNARPHPNADRLQLAECFGNTVCVPTTYPDKMIGVYFPTDGQLSVEFAEANNLVRKKDENGNNIGGYMDAEKRNVQAIRLRGEKSDGLFMPLECLSSFGDITDLKEGDVINVFNGHEICKKYIPKQTTRNRNGNPKERTENPNKVLYFKQHTDTEQLAYNLGKFQIGDKIEITLKMHGTSQRTGYLPVKRKQKRTLLDVLLHRDAKTVTEWEYVTGTRRTVAADFTKGYTGNDEFRNKHAHAFSGKLWKGETVYYEIVGFTTQGAPIMKTTDNTLTKDKEFIKKYGKQTVFSYGCTPDGELQSDVYIYRMTMTNEDGDIVEYTPDFMRHRCEQMGVKCVPVFAEFILHCYDLEAGEIVQDVAEKYFDGADPVGGSHIREGVVVRIVNKPTFTAFKHKNFNFKVIEGIAKATADAPDMEEADEVDA